MSCQIMPFQSFMFVEGEGAQKNGNNENKNDIAMDIGLIWTMLVFFFRRKKNRF